MEIRFTPEQEAQLSELAAYVGIDSEQLVKDAALQLLEQDARFRSDVQKGIDQADRGELLSHEDVGARLDKRIAEKRSRQ